jgi:hypothetical protein
MKKSRLNHYSPLKVDQLNAEVPDRIALCLRAGGTPMQRLVSVYSHGQTFTFTKVECLGGVCESCHQPQSGLEPHETKLRSQGGQVSLANSIMVCRNCHRKLQHNEPIWSRKE